MSLNLTSFQEAGRSTRVVVNNDRIDYLLEIAGGKRTRIYLGSGDGVDVEGDLEATIQALAASGAN